MKAILSIFMLLVLLCQPIVTGANEGESLPRSAHDIYMEMLEAGTTFRASEVTTEDGRPITYGAEKEASSSLITRVMGPGGESFKTWMLNQSEGFLRQFMSDFASGRKRLRTVTDVNGENVSLTSEQLRELRSINYETADIAEVKTKFERFIEMTRGKPFSYLTTGYRRAIFNGEVTGQSRALKPRQWYDPATVDYSEYVPNFGPAEKYVRDSHGTGVGGWEINFRPMPTYGQFEEMIMWFRTELQNVGKLFQAPGHQRLVFPEPTHLEGQARAEWHGKTNEMLRAVQAYIIARGILGRTGIENANHKTAHTDGSIRIENGFGRGVIRGDTPGRFVEGTYSVELRAGTKDPIVQQFVEQVMTARIAAGDFSGLHQITDYELNTSSSYHAEDLARRFGVSTRTAEAFLRNASNGVKMSYQIALWKWENAPFMSGKRDLLRSATRTYIERVANASDATQVKDALRDWVRTTQLDISLRNYMRPRALETTLRNLMTVESGRRVDVNRIDLGIEYSGRFGSNYSVEATEHRLQDGNRAWLSTVEDMTPHERYEALRGMAQALGRELNGGRSVRVTDVSEAGAHGHGLSMAFEVRDAAGKKWRVEWDGVGRTYDSNGQVIPESLRGGHVEIVTPKMVPNFEQLDAVYRAMESQGISPSLEGKGGGHINVDLAPFEGKPRELARFLTLFHQHRGIIAFLFTNMNRQTVAEAVQVSPELQRQLRDFNGSELQLKRLLYNQRYFNQRLGRKTRNVQIDMSGYFQDVIPSQFISEDFDIKNPNEPWRRQFRVDPRIRKMEMRLFDSPLDTFEASLQVKLVRALLNKALNSTSNLSGNVQEVQFERYAQDYELAERHLQEMCRELGLEAREFKSILARSASQGRLAMSSRFYETYDQKVRDRGWDKVASEKWEQAAPRERAEGISSEGRAWQGTELPEARRFREARIQAARGGEAARNNHNTTRPVRREIQFGVNCRSVFR